MHGEQNEMRRTISSLFLTSCSQSVGQRWAIDGSQRMQPTERQSQARHARQVEWTPIC
jgi:hypothetical protein